MRENCETSSTDTSPLPWKELEDRLRNGSNPVEVAGYGRESTHKGYLSWMLDTSHWPAAPQALRLLLERATWPGEEDLRRAMVWFQTLPDQFQCGCEKPVGGRKVDLLVPTNDGTSPDLPIELKVDSGPGDKQFEEMSEARRGQPALVLLLGTAAIRDKTPDFGDKTTGFGVFGILRPKAILDAWRNLQGPQPVSDWIQALEHEVLRLGHPFDLPREYQQQRDQDLGRLGYRSDKHIWYARLAAVRDVMTTASPFGAPWTLYDGGYNAVLNLSECQWSWVTVAAGVKAYWEFNDDNLVLKVEQREADAAARAWLSQYQQQAASITSPHGPKARPKKAKAGSTWISVLSWRITFRDPHQVAADAIEIIRAFSKYLVPA
jgi:hypothetical protein